MAFSAITVKRVGLFRPGVSSRFSFNALFLPAPIIQNDQVKAFESAGWQLDSNNAEGVSPKEGC